MAPCSHVCSLVRSRQPQQGACVWAEFNVWAVAVTSSDAVVLFRVFLFSLCVKLCAASRTTMWPDLKS